MVMGKYWGAIGQNGTRYEGQWDGMGRTRKYPVGGGGDKPAAGPPSMSGSEVFDLCRGAGVGSM